MDSEGFWGYTLYTEDILYIHKTTEHIVLDILQQSPKDRLKLKPLTYQTEFGRVNLRLICGLASLPATLRSQNLSGRRLNGGFSSG